MRLLFSILTLTFAVFATHAANAGEVISAGTPVESNMPTGSSDFQDIYQRQLEYRVEANKLEAQMEERQQNFAAPRAEAYNQYLENVDTLDETRGSAQASSMDEMVDDEELSDL